VLVLVIFPNLHIQLFVMIIMGLLKGEIKVFWPLMQLKNLAYLSLYGTLQLLYGTLQLLYGTLQLLYGTI
jgi:hypothetical protein